MLEAGARVGVLNLSYGSTVLAYTKVNNGALQYLAKIGTYPQEKLIITQPKFSKFKKVTVRIRKIHV